MLKGWRTLIVNGLLLCLYVLEWDQLVGVVPETVLASAPLFINAALRLITTTPIGGKT